MHLVFHCLEVACRSKRKNNWNVEMLKNGPWKSTSEKRKVIVLIFGGAPTPFMQKEKSIADLGTINWNRGKIAELSLNIIWFPRIFPLRMRYLRVMTIIMATLVLWLMGLITWYFNFLFSCTYTTKTSKVSFSTLLSIDYFSYCTCTPPEICVFPC